MFQKILETAVKLFYCGRRAAKKIEDDRVTVYAAQASFFIIISALPLLILTISALQYVIPIDRQSLTEGIIRMIPSEFSPLLLEIISEVYGNAKISIISFTTVALLWSSSRGVKSISNGLQNIYSGEQKTGFLRLSALSLLYTAVFIAMIVLSLMILVFGNKIQTFLYEKASGQYKVLISLIDLKSIIFLVLLTLIFAIAYKTLTKTRMKLKTQFPGALFSALGWLLFSFFYSIYIENFSNHSYLYGSLGALILFMLWLYMCMIIFLLGGEINLLWYHRKNQNNRPRKEMPEKKPVQPRSRRQG